MRGGPGLGDDGTLGLGGLGLGGNGGFGLGGNGGLGLGGSGGFGLGGNGGLGLGGGGGFGLGGNGGLGLGGGGGFGLGGNGGLGLGGGGAKTNPLKRAVPTDADVENEDVMTSTIRSRLYALFDVIWYSVSIVKGVIVATRSHATLSVDPRTDSTVMFVVMSEIWVGTNATGVVSSTHSPGMPTVVSAPRYEPDTAYEFEDRHEEFVNARYALSTFELALETYIPFAVDISMDVWSLCRIPSGQVKLTLYAGGGDGGFGGDGGGEGGGGGDGLGGLGDGGEGGGGGLGDGGGGLGDGGGGLGDGGGGFGGLGDGGGGFGGLGGGFGGGGAYTLPLKDRSWMDADFDP